MPRWDNYTSTSVLQTASRSNWCAESRKRKDSRSSKVDCKSWTNTNSIHPEIKIDSWITWPNYHFKITRIAHCVNLKIECDYIKGCRIKTSPTLSWYSKSSRCRSTNFRCPRKISVLSWKTLSSIHSEASPPYTPRDDGSRETIDNGSQNQRRQEWAGY